MLSLYNLLSLGNTQASLVLHSLTHRFLGLDAECGDQGCQLLDVNHNLLRWLQHKSRLMTSSTKRHDFSCYFLEIPLEKNKVWKNNATFAELKRNRNN